MAAPRGGQNACCSKVIVRLSLPDMLSLVVALTFGLALALVAARQGIAEDTGVEFSKRHYVSTSEENYRGEARNDL